MKAPAWYYDKLLQQNFYFFIGNPSKDVEGFFRKKYKEPLGMGFNCRGKTIIYRPDDGPNIIIVWVKNKKDMQTIAHEAVHAANYCLDEAGVIPDFKNDEVQAYLVGLLTSIMVGN